MSVHEVTRSHEASAPAADLPRRSTPSARGMGDRTNPVIANAEELITALEGDGYVTLYSVEGALTGLASSGLEGATEVADRLRAAALADGLFDTTDIRFAQEYVDRHEAGEDRSFERDGDTALRHEVAVGMVAETSQLPAHLALHRTLDRLHSFYAVYAQGDYVEDALALADRMEFFRQAGQPIGRADWSAAHQQMRFLDEQILRRFAGVAAVENSVTGQRFREAWNSWLAVQAEVLSDEGVDVPHGWTRSQLEAASGLGSVPAYTERSYQQTEADVADALAHARGVIARVEAGDRFVQPADLWHAITRIQQMRPHLSYSDQGPADALESRLRTLFEAMPDPEGSQDGQATSGVSLDLSQPLGVSAIAGALNTIANDPGEHGTLRFTGRIEAQVGALIRGYVAGLLELAIGYAVSDTATCTLLFDANAAVQAGISLAGLARAGAEFAYGYNLSARFRTPDEAAGWLFSQLVSINDEADGRLLQLQGSGGPDVTPTVVSETRTSLAGQASAGADDIGISGELRDMDTEAGFTRDGQAILGPDGLPLTRSVDRQSATVGASFRSPRGWGIDASYTFTQEHVAGDVNAANDGSYRNHALSMGLALGRVLSSTRPLSEELPADDIQDAILDLFAQLEGQVPGGHISRTLLDGVFDRVVGEIYDAARTGRERRLDTSVAIGLTWNSVYEPGAQVYQNQYFRVSVDPSFAGSLQFDSGVVSGEASVEASGSVLVLETLGSETLTYIQQRREFAWSDTQWRDFVDQDRDAIQRVIDHLLDPEHHLYAAGFEPFAATRGYPAGGFDAGLAALEAYLDSLPRSIHGGDS